MNFCSRVRTVEQSFTQAVEQMQEGPLSWVPSFFQPEEYRLFTEGDTASWIRLPHGFCRRHPKLHCESDVKCLLCDRTFSPSTKLIEDSNKGRTIVGASLVGALRGIIQALFALSISEISPSEEANTIRP
jgi:hypothetical protein